MAVPKFKTSKAKTRSRRSANMKKALPALTMNEEAGRKILRHRVCPYTGTYRGKVVIPEGSKLLKKSLLNTI